MSAIQDTVTNYAKGNTSSAHLMLADQAYNFLGTNDTVNNTLKYWTGTNIFKKGL